MSLPIRSASADNGDWYVFDGCGRVQVLERNSEAVLNISEAIRSTSFASCLDAGLSLLSMGDTISSTRSSVGSMPATRQVTTARVVRTFATAEFIIRRMKAIASSSLRLMDRLLSLRASAESARNGKRDDL